MKVPRFALVLLAGITACVTSKPTSDTQEPAADEAPPARLDLGTFQPRNVIVVNVDTLRADALPQWGSPHATMPAMGAREGWVAVNRAISAASWTAPSVASLLTSRDLPYHNVRSVDAGGHINPLTAPTFAEAFRTNGYATAMFTGSDLLRSPDVGLPTGFENLHPVTDEPGNAEATVAAALEWLETRPDERPFFLFLQPVDPHGPYRPASGDEGAFVDPELVPFTVDAPVATQERQIVDAVGAAADAEARDEVLQLVRGVYDEQVLGVDRAMEALLAGLEAQGYGEDTLVVLAADHGETFYDGPPFYLGHGFTPRLEIVQVPLLFWGAGLPSGSLDCVASTLDVMPTVAQAVGVAGPENIDGRSLLGGCNTEAYSSVYEATDDGGEEIAWLAVTSAVLQISLECETGERFVYDLARDPGAAEAHTVDEVPGASLLSERLDAYRDEVLTALPELHCGP